MNHALSSSFELRVLGGEQRGASVSVRPGVPLTVSSLWHSDVVLRSPQAQGVELQLTLEGNAVDLQVRQGEVRLGTQRLVAGAQARAPLYAPIVVGDVPLALGELGDSAWSALFRGAPSGDSRREDASPTEAAASSRWHGGPGRLAVGGFVLATVSLALLALATIAAPRRTDATEYVARAQAALQAAGHGALTVRSAPDGALELAGHVQTAAQRQGAEQIARQHVPAVRSSLFVNEQIAAAVHDVYRVNGVAAEVRVTGPGTIQVSTQHDDAAALQRVEATARRDIAGLTQLQLRNAPPPHRPSPIPAIDDAGKRIAGIVSGAMAAPYIVTADGTRYFVGALLPTGHRVLGIEGQSVRLEREGELTTLAF
jgi:type III secretion protein D